jgi:hypothetical protein
MTCLLKIQPDDEATDRELTSEGPRACLACPSGAEGAVLRSNLPGDAVVPQTESYRAALRRSSRPTWNLLKHACLARGGAEAILGRMNRKPAEARHLGQQGEQDAEACEMTGLPQRLHRRRPRVAEAEPSQDVV